MKTPIYFTVGPTQLYPTLQAHMAEAFEKRVPSISHRGESFTNIYENTASLVKKLMHVPADFELFFLSSGTEAMERVIQNCVEKKSAHVVFGSFSSRWHVIAIELGRETEQIVYEVGEAPNLSELELSGDFETLCITQNETSSGASIDPNSVAGIRKDHPNAILAVDIVSSAPIITLDWSVVDIGFFSVQKAFGLPAGLAVMLVSPRAMSKAASLKMRGSIGSYHSFLELKKYADKKQTPETPNVLAIYLLGKVVGDMLEKGIERTRENITKRAEKIYTSLESSNFKPFVKNIHGRSISTICAETPTGSKAVIESMKQKGFIVGSGYGTYKDAHIRIGNFPAHADEDVEALLDALTITS